MTASFSRRHFIGSALAGASIGLIPFQSALAVPEQWHGNLLGTPFLIRSLNKDGEPLLKQKTSVQALFKKIASQISQQATLFDPTSPSSQLSRLNHTGKILSPAPEFFQLLSSAQQYFHLTNGLFDPTATSLEQKVAVQQRNSSPKLSPRFHDLTMTSSYVALPSPQTRVFLGGLVHGFLVDQTAEQLKAQGLEGWQILLGSVHLTWFQNISNLSEQTSSAFYASSSLSSQTGKIIDPATGISTNKYSAITVEVAHAAEADAFATAFSLMDPAQMMRVLAKNKGGLVRLSTPNGTEQVLTVL